MLRETPVRHIGAVSPASAALLTRPPTPETDTAANPARTAGPDVDGVPFALPHPYCVDTPRSGPLVRRPARAEPMPPRRKAFVALMWAAAAVAVGLLYQQVSQVDFGPVLASAQWSWVLVAAVSFAVALGGAALNLMACSPVRLRLGPTYAVQMACGFLKLLSPTAVGGAALNARYVYQAGASTPVAVASVGTAQVTQVVTTLTLLAVLGPVTGTSAVPPAVRGPLAWTVVGAVAVAVLVLLAAPGLRARLRRAIASVVVQTKLTGMTPRAAARRLLLAGGASVLLTAGLVLALTASVAAMGGTISPVPIGIAFLVGSAVGSAVPTPGGIGTVEAALVAALTASGQLVTVALPAVLIFRLVTVWLPMPVGWVAFQVLQRRGHV